MIIGDVELNDDERALLKTCPDFALFSNMSDELHKVEVLAAGVKHRWETSNNEDDIIAETEEDKRIVEEMKKIEAQSRIIFDPTNNEINLGRQRITDCPGNTRVFLPKPMPPIKEAMVAVRSSEWSQTRTEFKAKNTNHKGDQPSNLTPQQQRGLKSILKRLKEGLIVIIETDKTGKFCIMSIEDYRKAGEVHTNKDTCVGDDYVRETQRILNGHCSYLMKIFGSGSDHGHETRHREARINKSYNVPILRLLYKDHKGWKEGDGPLPTRGICGANRGMNTHLSELVSLILEPLASSIPGTWEVDSSSDYLSNIEDYNKAKDNQESENIANSILMEIIENNIIHPPHTSTGELVYPPGMPISPGGRSEDWLVHHQHHQNHHHQKQKTK